MLFKFCDNFTYTDSDDVISLYVCIIINIRQHFSIIMFFFFMEIPNKSAGSALFIEGKFYFFFESLPLTPPTSFNQPSTFNHFVLLFKNSFAIHFYKRIIANKDLSR